MRRTKLNEIIVVAADGPRGLADRFNLHSRDRWHSAWETLILHFPGDANLILQPLPFVFHLDELADGSRHRVECFGQFAELVALLHLYTVGEISLFNKLGS